MLFLLSDKTNIEDTESAYRKLKNSLDQFEFNWDKILNCNCVLEDEYNYHQQSIENFKNSVIEAQKEIEHKRKDLMDARSVHRLRQEYTILSQNIKKFQDPLEIN
ncbi:hypothetical protein MXB_200 [Myxobolus squamalis]|nr:hypothetical protein MXB_200 [Myxobolus squamalis]